MVPIRRLADDDEDWNAGFARSLAVFLNGEGIPDPDPRGQPVTDDSFYLLFNAHHAPLGFVVPDGRWRGSWRELIRTSVGLIDDGPIRHSAATVPVEGRELVVLQLLSGGA